MTLKFPHNSDEAQMRIFLLNLRSKLLPRALKLAKYDNQLADMIVSDVLFNVHSDITSWAKKEYFYASLNTTLKNKFIDYYRREKKSRQTISLETFPMAGAEEGFSNNEDTIREHSELMKAVQVYVETLNPTLQDVFRMYFILDYSHEEMAEERNISKEHSRQNLSRLIKKLRQEFN
jgi:RNA polymerase sigma factor (sigma-70 family)